MKRPDSSTSPSSVGPPVTDTAFSAAYPLVWSYLSESTWDDGKPRETSALSFTWKDSSWQVALNDKALKQSLYSTASTQKQALKLLEEALATGVGAWRPWKRGK